MEIAEAFLPVFAEQTPEQIGRFIGLGVAYLIIFASLIKCIQIMRRPTTSAICVSSLTCVLLAWLTSSIHSHFDTSRISLAIFGIVFTLLLITSAVLAIVGLIDYRRQQDRFIQGRAQAIWGLLFSSIFLMLICAAVFRELAKQDNLAQEITQSETNPENLDEGEAARFESLNFSFDELQDDWVPISVKHINPVASLAFMRKNPEVWFVIIAEKIGIENAFDNEALADVAEANLRAGGGRAKLGNRSNEKISGLQGIRFEADAVVSGQSLSYSNWVAAHNGYAYQLMAFSKKSDRAKLNKHARNACQKFSLLETDVIAYAEGVRPIGKHVSDEWGYKIDFRGDPGWITASREEFEVLAADFIGVRVVDGHALSMAVILVDIPSPDIDAAQTLSVIATSLFSFNNAQKLQRQVVEIDELWVEGGEISGTYRSSQSQFGYRMRLLIKKTGLPGGRLVAPRMPSC